MGMNENDVMIICQNIYTIIHTVHRCFSPAEDADDIPLMPSPCPLFRVNANNLLT